MRPFSRFYIPAPRRTNIITHCSLFRFVLYLLLVLFSFVFAHGVVSNYVVFIWVVIFVVAVATIVVAAVVTWVGLAQGSVRCGSCLPPLIGDQSTGCREGDLTKLCGDATTECDANAECRKGRGYTGFRCKVMLRRSGVSDSTRGAGIATMLLL